MVFARTKKFFLHGLAFVMALWACAASAQLTVAPSFSPTSVQQNSTASLTLTFGSSVGMTSMTNLATTAPITLVGLNFTSPTPVSNTCPATVTGVAANQVSLSPVTGPPFGDIPTSCAIVFSVTATGAPGSSGSVTIATNSFTTTVTPFSGPPTNNVPGPANGATATITISAPPPTMTVAVTPTNIRPDERVTATYTLTNSDVNALFIGTGRITVPPNVVINATPAPVNTCNTFGAISGSSFTFGMGFVPAQGSCTITLSLSAAANATYTLAVAPGNLNASGPGSNSNTSSAIFSVQSPFFSPLSANPSFVFAGGRTNITYRIQNPGAAAAASGTVTLPAGFNYAFPPASNCGLTFTGSGNQFSFSGNVGNVASPCDIVVDAQTPNNVAANYLVTVSPGNLVVGGSASANTSTTPLTTVIASVPDVSVAVSPTSVAPNVNATLTYTLTNPNNADLPIVSGSFAIPAGVSLGTVGTTCPGSTTLFTSSPSRAVVINGGAIPVGGSCTVTVSVNSPTIGTYNFPVSVGALVVVGGVSNGNSANAALNVSPAAGVAPLITSGALPAGTVGTSYSFTFAASGTTPITWSVVSGQLPPGLSLNTATGVLSGTPTTSGTFGLLIQAANGNLPNATQNVSIDIAAAAIAVLNITPPTLTFGAQTVGTTSVSQVVTLSSIGTVPLLISSISTTGDFAAISNCPIAPATLPADATCTATVTFTPTSVSPVSRSGFLLITTTNAAINSYSVSLTGTASPLPVGALTVAPAALNFAAQTVGTASAPQTATITNPGTANVTGILIGVTGAAFSRAAFLGGFPNCGATLAPGASCGVAIVFSPTAPGAAGGQLTVSAANVATVAPVTLTGTGAPAPVPVISLSGNLAFGDQIINTTSGPQTVTISNTGNATLSISNIAVTGTNAADFVTSGSCGSVTQGASCTINVRFRPQTVGAKVAQLTVSSNSGGVAAVDSITLTGNGVPVPRPTAELSATTVSFGNTIFGGAAPVQTLVLRNGGTVPLNIQSLVASAEYVQSNNCPPTLAPNATCSVQLQFTPLGLGQRAGDFVVNSNAATSPNRVPLTGLGCRWFTPANSRLFTTLCGN